MILAARRTLMPQHTGYQTSMALQSARVRLRKVIDRHCIHAWNDRKGQTAENVIATLRRAADD